MVKDFSTARGLGLGPVFRSRKESLIPRVVRKNEINMMTKNCTGLASLNVAPIEMVFA